MKKSILNSLNKKNTADIMGLTPMQEAMLFHYLKDPTTDLYVEQLILEISGDIDVNIFEKAWNIVVETNEMLRTVFRWEKMKHPLQVVLKKHHLKLTYHDLSGIKTSEKNKLAAEIKINDRENKFDLREIPFRVTLCQIEPARYQMIVSNHHILYDGWSNGIILKEFFTVYNNLVHKKKIQKPIKSKFKEFVKWLNTQDKKEQEKFWKEYLKGVETETKLPVKIKQTRGKQISSWSNSRISIQINKDNREKLEKFIHHRKITIAAFMYCTWGILLHKYINTRDVIFGTTVSGRSAKIKDIENVTGLFINTIPLRLRIGDGEKTKDMLYHVNEILTIREKYESTSLVDIKRYGQVENNSELFDSIVVLKNYPLDRGLMRENSKNSPMSLLVDSYSINEATPYDLTVGITIGEDIAINFSYPEELFEKVVIRRLSRHFIHIMENILKDDERDIPALEILSEKEKKQLLLDFNATVEEYPKYKTMHELFARQVERTPNNIALIFGVKELTYRELNKNSDSLAYLLREKGVGPGTIVGMMVERSAEMIIGILGILKSGGAYLPIDTEFPGERIEWMLKDSGASILVTTRDISNQINFEKEAIYLSDPINCVPTLPHLHLSPAPATCLAYIIYTSGSTGKPKGVLIEHFAAVNLVFSQMNRFGISTKDRVLQFSSICFDASVEQIFIALFSGAVLVLIDKNTLLEAGKFETFIASRSITHLHAVPSFLSNMELTGHYQLKRILSGGDVCPAALAKKWSKYCDFYNRYGPTETTVTSIEMLVKDVDETSSGLPIGRPINNTFVYLFDKWMKLVPLGAIGELYIGGEGVARGYLNRPELTAEKFVELEVDEDIYHRSVRSHKSHIIYKTGDLARWLPDGNMEFFGRIDHQVKIRGFRIEPGEIENQLLNYKEVKEAVVTVKKDKTGNRFLCAYIVSRSIPGVKISRLKDYLKQKLPGYMIPPYFVMLEKIPLTLTGKIDRKSLPDPDISTAVEYTPPGNEREKQLVNIWANLLEMDKTKIGMNDNFFELGGHSLKATLLMARIHKKFDTEIPLSQLFRSPTIRGLALYMDKAEKSRYLCIEAEEEKEYYVLSSAQKRLYFLEQMDAATSAYNIPAIFQLEGALDRDRLEETFVKLVQRHESLRTSFRMMEEEPVQLIHDDVKFEIEYYDLPVTGAGDRCKWEEDLASDFIRPFDLSQAPLLRAGLVKLPHTP
ncbi:MAG: amino acid adenylation domain-containing protein, partial [Candidatus Aminicenantes bacterium]